MNEYGFQLGEGRQYLIKEWSEKRALLKLIKTHWQEIDEYGTITLLGRVIEKTKIEGI